MNESNHESNHESNQNVGSDLTKEVNEENITQKKKKGWIIVVCVLVLAAIAAGIILGTGFVKNQNCQKQIDLGYQYLETLDYENAIAAFEAAIAIDPKNEEAYIALAEVYEEMAKEEIEKEEFEAASDYYGKEEEVLKQAEVLIASETIQTKLEELQTRKEDLENKKYSKKKSGNKNGENEASEDDNTEPDETILNEENAEEADQTAASVLTELTADLNGYDFYSGMRGNIIIVGKEGKYGAIDYDGNIVVPLDYNYENDFWRSANGEGYFVLSDSDTYYLFDAKGNTIYSGPNMVYADEFCYEVVTYQQYVDWKVSVYFLDDAMTYYWEDTGDYEAYDGDWLCGNIIIDYYSYDGNLLYTSRNESINISGYIDPAGSYDGKVLVTENIVSENYRIGYLNKTGNVVWIEKSENGSQGWGRLPFSGFVNGYFLVYNNYYMDGVNSAWKMYDEKGNLVYDAGEISHRDSEYTCFIKNNKVVKLDWEAAENETAPRLSGWPKGYYKNGHDFYNYGSKIVLTTEDENYQALVDLSSGDIESLFVSSYIGISDEKNWLVKQDDKWGYINHEGELLAVYDDASDFCKGYAVITENNQAYLIDEDLNVVEELGEATAASVYGDAFCVKNGEESKFYLINP